MAKAATPAPTLVASVALTTNYTNIQNGTALVITVTVTPAVPPATGVEANPTGTVLIYDGTTLLGTNTLYPAAGTSDASLTTLTTNTLPAGQDTLSAVYLGDTFYLSANSNTVTVAVEDFSITTAATNPPENLNINQGSAGSASFVIGEMGGFNGLVQVVCDEPEKSAELIDAHPDLIFFTGSSMNGQRVAERAAKQLIPVILELGGKDASLVFADCHLERAVEGITYGAFSNTGRVCVAVKRAYVEASIYEQFLAKLKERIASLQIGADYESDFIPLPPDQRAGMISQIEDAIALGARLQYPEDCLEAGRKPVVLTDVPAQARILNEESFGPVLCVAPFQSEEEAVALANASAFALSSSIWTGSRARGRRVALQLSAGSCAVNSVISVIANPYAPFGGNKLSGYGRYHGPEGLIAFSRTKTVMFSGDRKVRDINWFPFTSRARRQLAGLLRFRHGDTGISWLVSRAFLLLLPGALSLAGVAAHALAESRLSIEVKLPANAHGEIAYLVFNSAKGFPVDVSKALRHGFVPIPTGARQLVIDASLPPGAYAVSVYEDLNSNHRLDYNMLGIPREPVGASNNPHPHFGPPHFEECSFRIGTTDQTIPINLVSGS